MINRRRVKREFKMWGCFSVGVFTVLFWRFCILWRYILNAPTNEELSAVNCGVFCLAVLYIFILGSLGTSSIVSDIDPLTRLFLFVGGVSLTIVIQVLPISYTLAIAIPNILTLEVGLGIWSATWKWMDRLLGDEETEED